MVNFNRWKIFLILAACLWALVCATPNAIVATGHTVPGFMPSKTVNLGLDLRGGAHLMFEVDVDKVFHDRSENLIDSMRKELVSNKIHYSGFSALPYGARVSLISGENPEDVRKIVRHIDSDLDVTSPNPQTIEATLNASAVKKIQGQIIEQVIEIVRRRVDETGTSEPVIARQGDNRIILELPGVSDTKHIIDLVGTTAVLSFNLVDTGRGSDNDSGGFVNYPDQENPGRTIPVSRKSIITGAMLTNAQPSQSGNSGMPDVTFALNGIGTTRFCDVTRAHTGEPFAIVLDKKVISAPRINEPICGGRAEITGSFTVQQTADLALLLRAGALPASLKVVEERTVGPTLGSDSVQAGKKACIMALVFVAVFACTVYGLFGVFASIALLVNMIMIIAIMSMLQATLTLPGIAGIVLAIGLALYL
jgi:preprotein translocase subunit SecD